MRYHILAIFALLGGMVFLMTGFGLHGVLIPIHGVRAGFSSFELGWIGTGLAIGFTLGCILVPRLVRRVGHVRTFSTLTAILSVSILLNGLYKEPYFWILLRGVSGFCIAGCYMVAESWLNERVSNEIRGSVFSIYAMVTMVSIMMGQYMLIFDEESTRTLFMIGAILYALAVVPTAVSKAQSPAPLTHVELDLKGLFYNSPAAFVGAILCGVISSAWTTFGPVFGQQMNMTSAQIATLLAAAMGGSALFQYPLGRLSDRIDRRYAMVIAGIVGIASGTLITSLSDSGVSWILFIAAIFYGGVIFSIYSLVIAHSNDYASSGDFVKISSGMLILYGFGTMVGPLFTAQMMNLVGPSGVFMTTTLAHFGFGSYALYRTFRRSRVTEEERTDFQTLGITRTQTPETYNLDPRSDEMSDDEEEEVSLPPPVKVD